jgi:hypothetical protein
MDIAQLLHELRVISNVEIVVSLLPEMMFPTQAKSGLEWTTRRIAIAGCHGKSSWDSESASMDILRGGTAPWIIW